MIDIEYFENDRTNNSFLTSLINNSLLSNLNTNLVICPITNPISKIRTNIKPKTKKSPINDILQYDVKFHFPTTLLKSPPTSAAFFSVYNKTKTKLEYHAYSENLNQSLCHIFAVYMGHTASCIMRVPVDVVRQARTNTNLTTFKVIKKLFETEGLHFRVFKSLFHTVLREVPFCSIKFPLWEFLKITIENYKVNEHCETYESALAGAFAGGTAAAITMPIDLAYKKAYQTPDGVKYHNFKMYYALKEMTQEKGIRGLFAGVGNRVPMVAFGGFLFFMSYEQKKKQFIEDEE